MGLKIITDDRYVTVYRQDKTSQNGKAYTQYSLGVSSKNANGEWVNGFIDCQFKKDVEVPNKAKISIINSFYNVTEYNGKKYYKIFILDFEVMESGEMPAPTNVSSDGFMNIPDGLEDEGLPFN